MTGIVDIPQFWTLILWVPDMLGRSKGKDSFFGARLLFIATRASKGKVKSTFIKSLLETFGFPKIGMHR